MSKPQPKNQAADKRQDWAVLPFDEAEDDARWEKLIAETDELIKEAEQLEAEYGMLSMKNKITDLKPSERQIEDELF